MGLWVKSEYAGELAVLSAWVSTLVPIHVVYQPNGPVGSTVVFIRFVLFEIQFRAPTIVSLRNETTGEVVRQLTAANALAKVYPGAQLIGDFFLTTPVAATSFYRGTSPRLWQASLLWSLAAVLFLAALALSVALYFREEQVSQRLPLSEVRLMGLLLAAVAATMGAASVLYLLAGAYAGVPIPIGVVVVGVLSVALLRTAERENGEDEDVQEPDSEEEGESDGKDKKERDSEEKKESNSEDDQTTDGDIGASDR